MARQERNRALRPAVLALGLCIGAAAPGMAAVTPDGDTTVAATTTQDTIVGNTAIGTLNIDGGSSLSNGYGFVGYRNGSAGIATISGTGSLWTNTFLCIGESGNGTLSIDAGGQVSDGAATLGLRAGSSGMATVSGVGSKWINSGTLVVGDSGSGVLTVVDGGSVVAKNLYASLDDLHGNGTITANGAILDAELIVDSLHGTAQTLAFGSGGSLKLMLDWTGELGVGYRGRGTLRIADGLTVTSSMSYLGYRVGSFGTATVNGTGTKWTQNGPLWIGRRGAGTLAIEAGGQVRNGDGFLGEFSGATGVAIVSGAESKWTNTRTLYVGYTGDGTLTVEAGGQVSNSEGHLGYNQASTGAVVVNGAGSKWTNAGKLYVGRSGSGMLSIDAGGQVSNSDGYISHSSGSSGTVTVTGMGSKWTNNGVLYIGNSGNGTLIIVSGGQVSSISSYLGYSAGSTGAAVVNGTGSSWSNADALHVGFYGSGTLTIEAGAEFNGRAGVIGNALGSIGAAVVKGEGSEWNNGGTLIIGALGKGTLTVADGGLVTAATTQSNSYLHVGSSGNGILTIDAGGQLINRVGYIAAWTGSAGTAKVNGAGAKWTNSSDLNVGNYGNGALVIEAGGQVSSSEGYLGRYNDSNGVATVSGAGSAWSNGDVLYVGSSGTGRLTVTDGGRIAARTLSINNKSSVHVQVSGDDMLALGNATTNGDVTNNGMVSLYADPFLAGGVYRPFSAYPGRTITWSGSGGYSTFGGIWDGDTKTFVVTESTALLAGEPDMVHSNERLLFTDTSSGRRVGASFGSMSEGITFSATPMGTAELVSLDGQMAPGRMVLGAWNFATSLSGTEAMLSFDVGRWVDEVSVWRLSGGAWSEFAPGLMTHDANGIASFTVSSFGGYAIAGVEFPQWQGDDPATPAAWTTAQNWSSLSAPGKGGVALFTQSGVSKSVDLGGGVCTAGLVRLASGESYTIGNGTLAIDNDGKAGGGIRLEGAGNGDHVISARLRIEDDASITIDGGSLSLSEGVEIADGKTLSVARAGDGALRISAITGGTGTLSLGVDTVTKLDGDSSVGTLVMETSARLDLGAELTVAAGSIEEINALVASGRAGGSWEGPGIMSSALAGGDATRTLAVLAEGSGVKVMQTWAGDLTGDWVVDGADYLVLDRGLLMEPGTLLYALGNIDYSADGITGDDFFHLDRSFLGQSMASGSAGVPGAVTAAVPEPGTLGLTALTGAMLLGRRRHRCALGKPHL